MYIKYIENLKKNNIMPDKIAFATVQKDMEPKPSNWKVRKPNLYVPNWQQGQLAMYYGCLSEEYWRERSYGWDDMNRDGTQEEWVDNIISQSSLFSGFTSYSPKGELWNGNVIQDSETIPFEFDSSCHGWGSPISMNPPATYLKYDLQHEDSIPVGPGTNYVGPFSIEEAATIIWRVKKWKINFNPTTSGHIFKRDCDLWNDPDCWDQPTYWEAVPQGPAPVMNHRMSPAIYGQPDTLSSSEKDFYLDKLNRNYRGELGGMAAIIIDKAAPVVSLRNDPSKYYIRMEISASANSFLDVDDRSIDFFYIAGTLSKSVHLSLNKSLGFIKMYAHLCEPQFASVGLALWQDGLKYDEVLRDHSAHGCGINSYQQTTSHTMTLTIPGVGEAQGRSLQIPLYGNRIQYMDYAYNSAYPPLEEGAPTIDFPTLGDITIEPIEYWPYDDGNGNPIWDTQTGAMLRDPVTGLPV